MRSGRSESVVGPDRQLPGKPGARVGLSPGYRVPTRPERGVPARRERTWCGPGHALKARMVRAQLCDVIIIATIEHGDTYETEAFFGGEAVLMMELPKRHSTPSEGGRFAPIYETEAHLPWR